MYRANAKLEQGFDVMAKSTNGEEYILKMAETEDGPMDYFTVAFSGCILMCAKGYFYRKYEILDLKIELDLNVDYENRVCTANLDVYYPEFTEEDKQGILDNIKLRCKISHLLADDVKIQYNINKK